MNYHTLLKKYRKELNIKQIDMYTNIISKSSYRKIESGERSPSIEELELLSDRLGIRLSEFLFRADITRRSSSFFGRKKTNVPSLSNNIPELEKEFKESYEQRFKNLQYYSIFLVCLIVSNAIGHILYEFSDTDIKELEKMYSQRKEFFGIDYEILANLLFIVSPEKLQFLFEKMLPVLKSHGDAHDISVQFSIKNATTVYLHENNFNQAKKMLEQYNELRKLPNFLIDGNLNLEMIYLEHLYNFLKDRNIEEYLNAVKIVHLFNQLGEKETHKSLITEVTEIAKKENFEAPSSITAYLEKNTVPIQKNEK